MKKKIVWNICFDNRKMKMCTQKIQIFKALKEFKKEAGEKNLLNACFL